MKHLLVVLYAGNYLDATERRRAGLPDRYRHHSYALATLEGLRAEGTRVTVAQFRSPERYDEVPDGMRFLGLGSGPEVQAVQQLGALIRNESVTNVMVRFPSAEVIECVLEAGVAGSVVLADSFPFARRRHRRYRRLGALMNSDRMDLVANHHVNSSRELATVLGVDDRKVIPWDWPLDLADLARNSARREPGTDQLRLCYVGTITRSKGTWDVLNAVARLRSSGVDASADIAGGGQVDELWRLADRLGIRDAVTHHGRIGADEVIELMRSSSFVCVPSHQAYPEGLPLTIYEAMASGTPLIASDHRMFDNVVRDGETGFVVRAGKPRGLADTALRVWSDLPKWGQVSATAAEAYPRLGHPTLWGDLTRAWIRRSPQDLAWLGSRSLAAGHRHGGGW